MCVWEVGGEKGLLALCVCVCVCVIEREGSKVYFRNPSRWGVGWGD